MKQFNKCYLKFREFFVFKKAKHKGSTLLATFLLSAMVLMLGLGTAKILIRELNISADLLFSEKAYYAAESTIELAVKNLKKNPVQNVDNKVLKLGETKAFKALNGASLTLKIDNLVDEFNIKIKENVK